MSSVTSRRGPAADRTEWELLSPRYADSIGERASLGLIALATDRAGAFDFREFLAGVPGVAVFESRVPMATVATPETLAAMAPHIEAAARLLVPQSRLDSMSFSCTSGTVAIGLEAVREAVQRARPGIALATPIDAAVQGLRQLGCRRISLLAPYLVPTAELVGGYFERNDIAIVNRGTFDLGGDPDMNRVSADCLIEAGRAICDLQADALFISCTGLRTATVVEPLERLIGRPVITSNQALAWQALRLAGVADALPGRGALFARA
jgi:maleate isomerase